MKMLMVAAAALIAPAVAFAIEVDGIAARVGKEAILKSEIMNELRRMGERDGSRYNEVRNEMIERKLIIKAARESKMTMQEWVIDNRIREIIAKSFGGDRNQLIETLGKQKVSYPEWRERMKEDMIVGAMRWNVIDKNVTASPAEMRKEFASHPERYTEGSKVTVSVIMLTPEEKHRRSEIEEAIKVKDFVALGGKTYKDINPADVFKPEVVAVIAKMPKGKVSDWIEIGDWSFLVRKDSNVVGRALSYVEAYDKIEANVKEENAKRLYNAWIDRMKAETYIKVF